MIDVPGYEAMRSVETLGKAIPNRSQIADLKSLSKKVSLK